MIPVATWYSSGWNRWWVVRAIILMSTLARLSFLTAFSPPNPDPMTTTRCRRSVRVFGLGVHALVLLGGDWVHPLR